MDGAWKGNRGRQPQQQGGTGRANVKNDTAGGVNSKENTSAKKNEPKKSIRVPPKPVTQQTGQPIPGLYPRQIQPPNTGPNTNRDKDKNVKGGDMPTLNLDIEPILRGPRTKSRNFVPKTVSRTGVGGFEILRRAQMLFVRTCTNEAPYLREAVNKFEVFSEKGKQIFWIKEMEGDGRKFSLGGTFDVIFCILSLDGKELIRCEGHRGKGGTKAGLSVFIGPLFVGDVIQKNNRYSSAIFSVFDDTQKDIAIIKAADLQEDEGKKKCRKCFCCGLSRKSGESKYFDIFLPDTRSRIGTAGKIAKFFPLLPRDIDDCFGVELSDAMTNKEKALLFAFCLLFVGDKVDGSRSSKGMNQQGDVT